MGFYFATLAGDDITAGRSQDKGGPMREEIRGGIAFRPEKRAWVRLTGKVKVVDARTIVYDDGTEVVLDGLMDAPELEQKGIIDGKLYSCGKEAAEYLRKLIDGRAVSCLSPRDHVKGKTMRVASAFIGETNLNVEMVRNGWAISDHEGMDPWEIVARENKRGLWRGQFTVPGRWRNGERLPGE
jgi:endonuclease YncB( thermonuclease family)